MKSMTRFVTVLLALLMVVALGACGGTSSAPASSPASAEQPASSEAVSSEPASSEAAPSEPASSEAAPSEPASSEAAPSESASSEVAPSEPASSETAAEPQKPAAAAGDFAEPVLVISVGNSADGALADSILKKYGISYTSDDAATGAGSAKTVIVVPGVSTKGLGAAGISVDDEYAHASALADSLKSGDATVLLAHLGGDSRRDELSDKFIDVMLPAADYIVVLEAGNKDGKFSSYASANGIPIKVPAKKADAITHIAGLFGK